MTKSEKKEMDDKVEKMVVKENDKKAKSKKPTRELDKASKDKKAEKPEDNVITPTMK